MYSDPVIVVCLVIYALCLFSAIGLCISMFISAHKEIRPNIRSRIGLTIIILLLATTAAAIVTEKCRDRNAAELTAKQSEIETRQAEEVLIVKEYEENKSIDGAKAWWLSMTPEQLKFECDAIAGKLGYNPQSLLVLLSRQNCIITWAPAGSKPQS